jgi:hypothetical protein
MNKFMIPPYFPTLIKKAKKLIQEQTYSTVDGIATRLMGESDYVSPVYARLAAELAMNELHDKGVGIYFKKIETNGAPLFKCLGDEKED